MDDHTAGVQNLLAGGASQELAEAIVGVVQQGQAAVQRNLRPKQPQPEPGGYFVEKFLDFLVNLIKGQEEIKQWIIETQREIQHLIIESREQIKIQAIENRGKIERGLMDTQIKIIERR
ncbi:MAG: hypothetical protein PHW74_13140 [Desulfobacca sp.]|nr:hypothetical protein [Desulfobacca sp.]